MTTASQRATIKAHIEASQDPAVVSAMGGGEVGRDDTTLAALYNLEGTYVAWKKNTSKADIFKSITWKNLTPVDTPDGTALWGNRSRACQGNQFNLQTMLISPGMDLDMSENSVRAGIKDALQNLPSGANGAILDAGWSAVKSISTRYATIAEELFATGTGTNGSPGVLSFEGAVTIHDIGRAFNGE